MPYFIQVHILKSLMLRVFLWKSHIRSRIGGGCRDMGLGLSGLGSGLVDQIIFAIIPHYVILLVYHIVTTMPYYAML